MRAEQGRALLEFHDFELLAGIALLTVEPFSGPPSSA